MNVIKSLALLVAATLTPACGTLEDNAWMTGVSREEALEIRRTLLVQKHAHTVYQYQRQEDGSVIVSTDVGSFQARRVRGKWVFTEVAFVGGATY